MIWLGDGPFFAARSGHALSGFDLRFGNLRVPNKGGGRPDNLK
jgi:hypothetical protein